MNIPARDGPLLRHGAVGTAAMGALVLLGLFYSVVAGAVDRADTQRRAAIQLEAAARAAADARFAARSVVSPSRPRRGWRSAIPLGTSPSGRRIDAVARSRSSRPRPAVIIGTKSRRGRAESG